MNYNKIIREHYLFVLVTNTNTPAVPGLCQPNTCLNGGTCTSDGADFTCNCNTGFTGKDCSTTGKKTRISCFRLQQLKYLEGARQSPVLAISGSLFPQFVHKAKTHVCSNTISYPLLH